MYPGTRVFPYCQNLLRLRHAQAVCIDGETAATCLATVLGSSMPCTGSLDYAGWFEGTSGNGCVMGSVTDMTVISCLGMIPGCGLCRDKLIIIMTEAYPLSDVSSCPSMRHRPVIMLSIRKSKFDVSSLCSVKML